uniref:Uncharacterized protein LOC114348829 n=1 Tax=Diabrotica virgifera virgifera TaxID=50390 RepID=A0A6P7HBR8_DIAVI
MDGQIDMGIILGREIEAELQRQLFKLERRVLRDTSNPFEIPDELFKGLYRLPKQIANNLIHELEPFLMDPLRITSFPIHLKVLCALHFYAHGSYQKSVGQDFLLGMSQSVVSRCIGEISRLLSTHLSRRYIIFPTTIVAKISVARG